MISIEKIIQIESGDNPNAYNEKSGAVGLMQITPIVLKEWNSLHETVYGLEDLKNSLANKRIGVWYLEERIPHMFESLDIPDCDFFRLIAYNWGINNLKNWYRELPKETQIYIEKYERMK